MSAHKANGWSVALPPTPVSILPTKTLLGDARTEPTKGLFPFIYRLLLAELHCYWRECVVASTLDLVAVDIETTGFGVHDVVTVLGFELPLGARVFCNTGGDSVHDLDTRLQSQLTRPLVCSTHNSEAELLATVTEYSDDRLRDDDVLITAYNGETWSGGFDLPFLRTRFALQNVAWPFRDLPYSDLLPLISDLFNTTLDGDDQADLVTAYDVLCEGSLDELDPFDDSGEAVEAFEDGRFEPLVLHNLSDIGRTRALGLLAQRYCSKSDFQLKSLTPTIHD